MKKLLLILLVAFTTVNLYSQQINATKARTGLIVGDERISGTNVHEIDSITKRGSTYVAWDGVDTAGFYIPVEDRLDFDTEILDLVKVDSIGLVEGNVAFYYNNDTINVYVPYAYRDTFSAAYAEFATPLNTGNVTANVGLTAGMLSPNMYYNGGSAINISSDPQIVDGYAGQTIIIHGSSDTNTLTLDDGTGLQLAGAAQCVLGIGDAIELMYSSVLDLWIEISRSAN